MNSSRNAIIATVVILQVLSVVASSAALIRIHDELDDANLTKAEISIYIYPADSSLADHEPIRVLRNGETTVEHELDVPPEMKITLHIDSQLGEVNGSNPRDWTNRDMSFKVRVSGVPDIMAHALETRRRALAAGNVEIAAYASYLAAEAVPEGFPQSKARLHAEAVWILNQVEAFGTEVPLIATAGGPPTVTRDFSERLKAFQASKGIRVGTSLGEMTYLSAARSREIPEGNQSLRQRILSGTLEINEPAAQPIRLPAVELAAGIPNPRVVFTPDEPFTWNAYNQVIAELRAEGKSGDAAWLAWRLHDRASEENAVKIATDSLKAAYGSAAERLGVEGPGYTTLTAGTVLPSESLIQQLSRDANRQDIRVDNSVFDSLKTIDDFKPLIMDAVRGP